MSAVYACYHCGHLFFLQPSRSSEKPYDSVLRLDGFRTGGYADAHICGERLALMM